VIPLDPSGGQGSAVEFVDHTPREPGARREVAVRGQSPPGGGRAEHEDSGHQARGRHTSDRGEGTISCACVFLQGFSRAAHPVGRQRQRAAVLGGARLESSRGSNFARARAGVLSPCAARERAYAGEVLGEEGTKRSFQGSACLDAARSERAFARCGGRSERDGSIVILGGSLESSVPPAVSGDSPDPRAMKREPRGRGRDGRRELSLPGG